MRHLALPALLKPGKRSPKTCSNISCTGHPDEFLHKFCCKSCISVCPLSRASQSHAALQKRKTEEHASPP